MLKLIVNLTTLSPTSYDRSTNRGALSGSSSCNSSRRPGGNVRSSDGAIPSEDLSIETRCKQRWRFSYISGQTIQVLVAQVGTTEFYSLSLRRHQTVSILTVFKNRAAGLYHFKDGVCTKSGLYCCCAYYCGIRLHI